MVWAGALHVKCHTLGLDKQMLLTYHLASASFLIMSHRKVSGIVAQLATLEVVARGQVSED